jgi:hydroxyacylglutathione hydrolase
MAEGHQILDVRTPATFSIAHIRGAINVSLRNEFTKSSLALIPKAPLILVAENIQEVETAADCLAQLGIVDVNGFLAGGMYSWEQAKLPTDRLKETHVDDLIRHLEENRSIQILDVREATEFKHGHLPGAINAPISGWEVELPKVDSSRPVVLICSTSHRSTTAASLLARKGFSAIHYVPGGMAAWIAAGYPVEEHVMK